MTKERDRSGARVRLGAPASGPAGSQRSAADPGSDQLAEARATFLDEGTVRAGLVRGPILASWERARSWQVRPDHLDLPFEPGVDGDSLLTRAAEPVIEDIADLFATEPVSVILCDADGVVLDRRTGDSALEQHLNRVWLAPGFSYAERYVGTNGIGTALEGRGVAEVFGHEHFVEHLEELACAGAPIRHPVTGRVLGVVDLTCWRRDAGPLMVATATTLTHRIERMLLEHSGRREVALLNDYLDASRRHQGAVLALSEDIVMMNDRARELLEPADQSPLLAEANEALAGGREGLFVVDLPSGRTARVRCRPTVSDGGVVGGVLDVHLLPVPVAAGPRPTAPARRLATVVGSGAVWAKCCREVDRHLQQREWVVLEGEPGAGRESVARAAHQSRTPAARLIVFRAEEYGPGWSEDLAEELATSNGSVILTHLDQLPAQAVDELGDILEPYRESTAAGRFWLAATITPGERAAGNRLDEVLEGFPRTIEVPPLRRHIEDVAELVPHLLARLTHNSPLTCPPDVMRVLMHNRWPGNVEQLYQVLRKIVAHRRAGVVELGDLPAECWVTSRRVLGPLESLECDAIVEALIDAHGNKVEAARRLAMSRATIYRKIRDFGIAVPSLVAGP